MPTLKDKLSHLSYAQACKLLAPEGKRLLQTGGYYNIDIDSQVTLKKDLFLLDLGNTSVMIHMDAGQGQGLILQCTACPDAPCEHKGAALSLILEEKMALGLSAPPPEKTPVESLSEAELVEQALADRKQRAETEPMRMKSMSPQELWTDYIVSNATSGKSYRVALRGWDRGQSYCTCPDFRKNTLGTCKHIIYVIDNLPKIFNKTTQQTPPSVHAPAVYLTYGQSLELRMLMPDNADEATAALVAPFADAPVTDIKQLLHHIRLLENNGHSVTIYPDAEEYINQQLYRERVKHKVEAIRRDPANHPLRKSLLNKELLPYQMDGIAFAVGAGRAVLADDMGLGKTIQGIGVAELLSQDADISRVLVISPASLKSQWQIEIRQTSSRSCHLVLGNAQERETQYDNDAFFTICNYEQVLRDLPAIEKVNWDLIILDEAQRIKNWETKTSQTIKALKSQFALVLTGTPLENRLDELFSVVEFVDDRRLGPAFRFYNRYRVVNEKGKVLGYKNLDELRQRLAPVLLRRTRSAVIKDLPPRTTTILRVPPTPEQIELHNSYQQIVSAILNKKYITEMDLLRLQKALLMCRMCADSTYLVEKTGPGSSGKLAELETLLDQLVAEEDRKIVLFSEWTTMLNLIEPLLADRGMDFVRLDGSVPQKKRQHLMHRFQNDPDCKLFITTNAGSTGLNLQAANTVINVDLPWNPAVLEQRIGRAHRLGQQQPVQVYILVTERTLEENLLGTLSMKQELFLSVLDPEADTTELDMTTGLEELKNRLEVLLGTPPEAPEDDQSRRMSEEQAKQLAQKEKAAQAGARLMESAFTFMGEMFPAPDNAAHMEDLTSMVKEKLTQCMDTDDQGRPRMTFTLPDESMLDNMAHSLARIIGHTQAG
ncbi:MAG: DEAD/DEAH box helicase [Thermodesulfobacteriota bacterium]|nr:DEAD/DEAH box helicase [Thermodesulfobacteriota bacterium]